MFSNSCQFRGFTKSLTSFATLLVGLTLLDTSPALAQLAPEIGYMLPSGGQAGTSTQITIGGYDWTPDMQLLVHDPRIQMALLGPPTPVLVPGPPYWIGAKGRGPAWPLSREFSAKLTIPADVPPGLVKWQVANANGVSPVASFQVGDLPEVAEQSFTQSPRTLPALPITLSGQITKIEEIDEYEFSLPQAGLVSLELIARRVASPLHGMLQVRDAAGKVLLDLADTEGRDLTATFAAAAGMKYTVRLHDLDFAGDRSYVYRLKLATGPRVLAAFPSSGKRGETRAVDFVGIGLVTGTDRIESLTQPVTFPVDAASSFVYRLPTAQGPALPFHLGLSDLSEQVEPVASQSLALSTFPTAITGALEVPLGIDQYLLTLKKDEKWQLSAASTGSLPLDLNLTLTGPDGKELAISDDSPTSINPQLMFTAAADGEYRLLVSDRSGKSGSRLASYRVAVLPLREDFTVTVPALLSIPLGGTAKLPVQIVRLAGFKESLQLSLTGLPPGITVPDNLTIPADKSDLAIDLTSNGSAAATAALASLQVTAKVGDQMVTREAGKVALATTMKPRIKITPEGLDDVRKVHRGSTFLAPLLIERLEGYQGEIMLEMTAKQQRHRQGLASDEFTIPPPATRVEYPIFVPEWMETTKTSRMILNGRVQLADPQGNVRTLLQRMELRIGILPEGALLKLTHEAQEYRAELGQELQVPLHVSRVAELHEGVTLELLGSNFPAGLVTCEAIPLTAEHPAATAVVKFASDPRLLGEQTLTFRAKLLKDGWPVVSETSLPVTIGAGK